MDAYLRLFVLCMSLQSNSYAEKAFYACLMIAV